MTLVLLLGGARSGKSRLGQRLALATGAPVTVVATATAGDAEMAEKIAAHRRERPQTWRTLEEPHDLLAALSRIPADHTILVDCLTLWVANLVGRGDEPDRARALAREAAAVVTERSATTIVISNEVGLGVVPATELGRVYRDLLGEVNQVWSTLADRVLFTVAGKVLPLADPEEIVRDLTSGG